MRFCRVDPENVEQVRLAADLLNQARDVDDPDGFPVLPALLSRNLRYGWDLQPDTMYLCTPDDSGEPVGVLQLDFPQRDNRHLAWASVDIAPAHRRRGHGSAVVAEVLARTRQLGRTTVWLGAPEDDLVAKAFAEGLGFAFASHDARRRQVLADVDREAVERLHATAAQAASGYRLERQIAPTADDVLAELVEVTAAINDAPMGDLTYEEEVFDLKRLQDIEAAGAGRGDTVYRIWARHRTTGEIGGHTVVMVNPLRPYLGIQGDTAVSRGHRGHRLGLLLKIEMMRWLAETEPQLELVETWNNADNDFMVSVNEAIGYRLSRIFALYERNLTD